MTETIQVGGLSFELVRSQRRTLVLRIERDGTLAIAAPRDLAIARIRRIAEDRAVWVYGKLAERTSRQGYRPKEFVTGEAFDYLGRTFRLRLTEDDIEGGGGLLLRGGDFELPRREAAYGRDHFTRWYTDRADTYVRDRVETWSDRLESHPSEVRIRDLRRRWGSCSASGILSFNWRIVMAPASVVEYVVVHELIHLAHGPHDRAFWTKVGRVIPDFAERKVWLRANGAALDI